MMTVTAWCKAVGISRSGFYALSAERSPVRSTGEGERRLVSESPYLWLERVKGIKLPVGLVVPVTAVESTMQAEPAVDWVARAREVGETQALREMRASKLSK
jgi:hypothetical protein